MNNLEYIADYFTSPPTDVEQQQFEQRIIHDIAFAEEVAFYISANGAIKEQSRHEKKQRFREIYNQPKVVPIIKRPVIKIVSYLAAAAVVAALILVTWFFSVDNTSPRQLSDQYIQQNFQTLSVTMGNPDSLQTGLSLFNNGKLNEALILFESMLKNDTGNGDVKKYAGIVSLRLAKYDQALAYFSSLASEKRFSNYGRFYEAVTLLQRNETGDVAAAKKILQQVVEKELDGKEEAAKWLKKLS